MIRLKGSPATLAFCHLVMAVAARIERDKAAQKEMPAEIPARSSVAS